jgi:Domain of unknown function (DUF4337)
MATNDELIEHTEHARQPFERRVAVSMAVIAALLAIVSVAGHVLADEELLLQQQSSDQWAFYQAKSIRRYESDIARDLFAAQQGPQAAAGAEKYAANLERYQKEGDDIQTEAKKLAAESQLSGRRALRAHIGEVFLEIGIVFASLAILTRRSMLWSTAIVSATLGVAIAATTMLVH